MKKLFTYLFIYMLTVVGVYAQAPTVTNMGVAENSYVVTFDIEWGNRAGLWSDTVWVFVEYTDPVNGSTMRMNVDNAVVENDYGTGVTIDILSSNKSGFYVIGDIRKGGKTSAKATIKVSPVGTPGTGTLRGCVYAMDYPPVLKYTMSGSNNMTANFTGTPPFSITTKSNGTFDVTGTSYNLNSGDYVTGFHDATVIGGGLYNGKIECGDASPTLSLTAGSSRDQIVCQNGALTPIQYTMGGSAINYSATDLPAGITATRSGNVITISGTSSVIGVYNYTIETVGLLEFCGAPTQSGTIQVVGLPNSESITVTPAEICGEGGGEVSLMATAPDMTMVWYDHATEGDLVHTGNTYTINNVEPGNYTYYVAARTTNGCVSLTRKPVTANVSEPATINLTSAVNTNNQTVCPGVAITNITYQLGGSASSCTVTGLPASMTAAYNTGTNVLTISGAAVSGPVNYNVTTMGQTGSCAPATATGTITVNPVPAITTQPVGATICSGGTTTLSVVATGATAYQWRLNGTNVTQGTGGTTANYTTPALTANANYDVVVSNASGCSVTSNPVVVTVNPAAPIPSAGTPQSICGQGTMTISASVTGAMVDWYAAPTGGTPLHSNSNTYTTPAISTTTIYYAEARIAATGCVSPSRAAVTATVYPLPAAPQATNNNRCGTGVVAISAAGASGEEIRWYANATGGAVISTGSTYSPSITATTTYYAEARNTTTGCVSATRTAVTATADAASTGGTLSPAATVLTAAANPALTLSGHRGSIISWQSASDAAFTAGTASINNTTTTYTDPVAVKATKFYRAVVKNGACGPVNSAVAQIAPKPAVDRVPPSACEGLVAGMIGGDTSSSNAGACEAVTAGRIGSSTGTGGANNNSCAELSPGGIGDKID